MISEEVVKEGLALLATAATMLIEDADRCWPIRTQTPARGPRWRQF